MAIKDLNKTYYIGRYNVDFNGDIYDEINKTMYTMMLVDEFDKNEQATGFSRTYYADFSEKINEEMLGFLLNEENIYDLVVNYPNYVKIYFDFNFTIKRI